MHAVSSMFNYLALLFTAMAGHGIRA